MSGHGVVGSVSVSVSKSVQVQVYVGYVGLWDVGVGCGVSLWAF